MDLEPVKKAKKGIFHILFSRVSLLFLLVLLQLVLLVKTITYLGSYASYLYVGFVILAFITVIFVVNSKGNPAFKISWILFVLATPIVGSVFYLCLQIQPETRYLEKRLDTLKTATKNYMKQDHALIQELRKSKPANANLSYYMNHQLSFPTHCNTKVKYLPSGEQKFEVMKEELRKAQKFIFLEYFIVEEGKMWNEILAILKEKAKTGVEVRFMYDGMCSMIRLPYRYPKQLQQEGIQCKVFSPIRPVLSSYQNNRDHRKICVIDGRVAFTGGVNLADEYINETVRYGHWKDTAIVLEGEAVQSFTMLFLQMWNVDVCRQEDFARYILPKADGFKRELGYVIPYGDSPFDHENVGEQVYFHILNHAKKYVHIMTPYLIIDNEMLTNLTYAAKSGIEVIIIMPHIPDKWYAFWVAHTYYEELLQAGVQIYEYTQGFVHAKVFVSDNDTATVGTINLDYRSLYHHFECGAFIYNNPVVWDIEKDFQETLKKCEQVTVENLKSRNLVERVFGRVLRLLAPLM